MPVYAGFWSCRGAVPLGGDVPTERAGCARRARAATGAGILVETQRQAEEGTAHAASLGSAGA